jgi:hypothetical protein
MPLADQGFLTLSLFLLDFSILYQSETLRESPVRTMASQLLTRGNPLDQSGLCLLSLGTRPLHSREMKSSNTLL